jgi:glycosyltransferase involved in cell wall biosynthesis
MRAETDIAPHTSRASRIVCPSEAGIRVKHANPDARTVIPNGLDPDRFDPAVPKTRRVLVVTRLVGRRVHICRAPAGFRPDYEVVHVGEGPTEMI